MSGREDAGPVERGTFIREGLGMLGQSMFQSWQAYREAARPAPPPTPERTRLRPPGARDEPEFQRLCGRSGSCVAACPFRVLEQDAEGRPVLRDPRAAPCAMCPDMPCIAACGSGALAWQPRSLRRIGLVRVEPDHCVVSKGTPCVACATACREARAITPGPDGLPLVLADACTGCGSCLGACPAEGPALELLPRS
ncbi:MAG: hypothetical protein FJY99_09970 [Candidatus Sericytochromatia bacterium]|nr:hypothetical protein [Candidatus Tanganyikabacteria bacterium]